MRAPEGSTASRCIDVTPTGGTGYGRDWGTSHVRSAAFDTGAWAQPSPKQAATDSGCVGRWLVQ
ncbi:MAG: hypothetical protein QOH19_598 [Actinomycetota bacterium]|jgi:hypothetical protein|nr:hypothetical protein [Actinomycetota bacterium]